MKVKKILALVMGALLAVMAAGCGADESSGAAASSGKAASSTASSSEKSQASGKKALVVYYSDTGRNRSRKTSRRTRMPTS